MKEANVGKKKTSFWWFYLGFVIVLACLVGAAVYYVNQLLRKYEETQPKYYVEQTMATLVSAASSGEFLGKYLLPEISVGKYEDGRNIKA